MKQIRPQINQVEMGILLEAMQKAGYHKADGSPHYKLYHRFRELQKGSHVKLRVTRRPQEA